MATPRQRPQTVAFVPQGSNQAKGSRSLPLGSLVEATNVRQVKEDEWRKRRGFARSLPTPDTSFYAGPGTGAVYAGGVVEREAASGLAAFWAMNEAQTERRFRGFMKEARPFPTYQDAGITLANQLTSGTLAPRRSVLVLGANSDRWTFTVGDGKFQYTVVGSDGALRKTATSVTLSNIEQLAAVYHPGQSRIYVLAITSAGTAVTSFSYNTSTYVQVSTATYHSGFVGITSLDAYYLTSPAEVAVVVAQYDSATPLCRVTQSYLDPSTLQPRGSPAAVNLDVTPSIVSRPDCCGGVSILKSTGQTTWYYSFWRASSNIDNLDLILNSVTTSTLANASITVLATVTTTAGEDYRGVTSGYVDTGNGNRVVLAQTIKPDGTAERTYDWAVNRYTWDGATTSTLLVARGAWLASKPCLVGSNWYFLTGREGGYNGSASNPNPELNRQGELYLRHIDGDILSQILPSVGAPVWHRQSSYYNDITGTQIELYSMFVTDLVSPDSTKLVAAVGRFGELTAHYIPTIVTWDLSAGYGSPAALGNLAVFPGPIPLLVGPRDNVREMFPLHAPPTVRVTLGAAGASGVASVCATYRFRDSDGRAWESAPCFQQTGTFFFSDNNIAIPTLKHAIGANAEICMYSTIAGGSILLLQTIVPNDPSVNVVNLKIWPVGTSVPAPTPLYTNGGGLSNAVTPPCRSIERWRDRLHLAGTPTEGEVWHSQEIVEGLAPTFNEVLRSFWQDAQGPVLGLKAVDWNYLAGFKRNGIGVIGGPGPDGRGQGAYIWQTLTTEKGLSDTGLNSLLSTPYGAAFQNEADGRICLVSTGLQVQDIMQGADSHRTLTVGAALLNEPERQAWFYCTDGTLLVAEYAWAGESKNLVNCWRKWSSANLLRAYGAVMTPTGPLHIESNGVIRTQSANWVDTGSGASVDVLMALETGRMGPFGLMQEGGVVGAHVLGQHIGASSLRVTVTCDDGTPSVHNVTTSSPVDYSMKPTGGFRCKEVRVRIEETASGNEGFVFEGVALDVVPYGRTRILPVSQRIA